jgi:hypothetical protein
MLAFQSFGNISSVTPDRYIAGSASTEVDNARYQQHPPQMNSAANWSVMLTHLPHRNGVE